MITSEVTVICRLPSVLASIFREILKPIRKAMRLCISYIPTGKNEIHNANTLGASLLARTFSYTQNEAYRSLAAKAIQYTANHQRADGSWYYGEATQRPLG